MCLQLHLARYLFRSRNTRPVTAVIMLVQPPSSLEVRRNSKWSAEGGTDTARRLDVFLSGVRVRKQVTRTVLLCA